MKHTGFRLSRSGISLILIVLCCAGIVVFPATGGERFISGSPDLSATIRGANEFYPATEVNVPVNIQNSGLIQYVISQPNLLTPADLPNTAKLMTVQLFAGGAPLTVLSDPQMVGDLMGGDTLLVNFKVRTNPDAPAGTYILPMAVQYTYLAHADQYGQDTLQYFYETRNVTLEFPLKIKPEIILQVVSAEPEEVNVGTEGFVHLVLENIGNEDGTEAVVVLSPVGNSPVQPVAGSVYVGDFPMKSDIDLRYKVSVSGSAEPGTYPVNVSVNYKNQDGIFVTSAPAVVGIPVKGKIRFSVVSPPNQVYPGTQDILEVTFENTGSAPVNSAQARIYTQDPFTTLDDVSYLGDMAVGETKVARFEVTVDQKATVKEYALDSEVRYRDALDNDQVSDRIPVPVDVIARTGVMALLYNPYFIVLLAVVIIVLAVLIRRMRKQRKG
ncbi:hypothetical protein J2741_002392 [Methanolinea mesophila]|uniref:COG1361 S-layer family protein n=1 Tax=Methanolinea mesophila TaxID=547055 RepID=UPI001AE42791|nr:COG1361 S-layer family protein [Methanolinea mesophila]MBP1929796.1 hypothetical protein [Methanolinea mesophila]